MSSISIVNSNAVAVSGGFSGDLYNRFVSYIDASQKTVQTYAWSIKQFFNYLSLNGIKQPNREDVLNYKAYLAETGHKPTTQQSYLVAVRKLFKWTEQEGIYPNIAENVKGVKVDTKHHKRDHVGRSDVKRLLDSVSSGKSLQEVRDYAMLRLVVTCGLRTIEVVRANVEDLATRENPVTHESFTVLYVQGKGRDERAEYVKVPEQAEQAIRQYLKMRGKVAGSDPLFTSTSNKNLNGRMTTRAVSGIIKGRMVSVGIDNPRITAHSLRHSAVTISLQEGLDLREVKQFARHADLATTLIYDQSLKEACNHCSEIIERAIS